MEAKISLFDKKVGDNIEIELSRYGRFTASLQKIEGKLFIFMFDDCIARTSMNQENTNKGGYKESYIEQFLSTDVYNAFPEDIRKYLKEVTLPTVGQIFGHNNEWCNKYLVMDENEQFPLMKKRQNRVACFEDDICWWWLQNPVKSEHSSANFAGVDGYGNAFYGGASGSFGVRPVFTLVRPESGGHVPQPEEVGEEWLRNKIKTKEEEIVTLKQEIKRLEKSKQYDDVASEMKTMLDSYVRAGFTKDQAFQLVLELSVAVIGGKK